jgi:hypothetical protein
VLLRSIGAVCCGKIGIDDFHDQVSDSPEGSGMERTLPGARLWTGATLPSWNQ